ncbi:MAG: transporter substrate-binding domain-containing protein, partial [Umezawaea sp.]
MFALLPALGLAVVAAAGCATSTDTAGTAGDSGIPVVSAGKLTTCTHLPYEPFQFEQQGKTVGFDVDMIDLVAKKLGVTQEIFDTPFEGIQSGEALNSRKC